MAFLGKSLRSVSSRPTGVSATAVCGRDVRVASDTAGFFGGDPAPADFPQAGFGDPQVMDDIAHHVGT